MFGNKEKRRRETTEFLALQSLQCNFSFSSLPSPSCFFSPLLSPDLKLISVEGDFKTVRTRNVRKSEERRPRKPSGEEPGLDSTGFGEALAPSFPDWLNWARLGRQVVRVSVGVATLRGE